VRHLLLALAACAALAPSAQAQPAVPQTTLQSSTPKVRLAELLRLAKRNDAKAVSEVSQRLMTDPDTTNRRVAALALDRMVDVATVNVVLGVALGALQHAATHDPDPKVQAAAAKVLVRLKRIASQQPTPATPWVPPTPTPSNPTVVPIPPTGTSAGTGAVCKSLPVFVRALNLTGKRIDVCAALQRASSQATWPSSLPSNAIALRVELTQLDRVGSGPLRCKVTITTSSQNGVQSQASGGAAVSWNASGGNRYAARDCVDAIVENLLVTKVVPALQVATTAAPVVSAPAPAASAAPGSSTPVPGSQNGSRDHEDD
jgi:hypothetical protein